ncbi:MAG: hypothetical protein F6K42_02190 [Leptolyngbya sp. SIO1D8]|nr:hypothetical protein [Leptolyngbya sp. SIO1D8]
MSSMDSYESWSSNNQASSAELEGHIYDHLRNCRQQESADAVLARFQQLFIQADGYSEPLVWEALTELAHRPQSEREFKYTLNRCSYTLVNPWYTETNNHWAIPELVRLFETIPTAPAKQYETHRIRHLSQGFMQTEQYAALKRFANLFDEGADSVDSRSDQPISSQLKRYPFLYDSSLLTKDSDQHQKNHVGELRLQAETKIGIKLARYHSQKALGAGSQFPNPTRLSPAELERALAYYTGKVEGNRSHRDLAQMFQTYSKTVRSFRDFKEEFLEYLLAPLADADPRYVNNNFGRALRQYLRDTLQDFNGQRLTDFIVITTCQKLLNFLVVQGRQQPVFRRFWQLLHEVGHTLTVGLLLRIVLFCSAVKPWLENRLSVLFHHHERYSCEEVPWLIDTLEHANVALITNFGKLGYSFL